MLISMIAVKVSERPKEAGRATALNQHTVWSPPSADEEVIQMTVEAL